MEREQKNPSTEEVFKQTQKEITTLLLQRGAVQNSPGKMVGVGIIRVVSDEWEENGHSALMLDANGEWSIKFDMMGYALKNPSFDELVYEYARIADPKARNFGIDAIQENKDFEAGYQIGRQRLGEYVQENKEQLADGLVNALQGKLKALQEDKDTNPNSP